MFMNINYIFIQATDDDDKIPSSYSCADCLHNLPLGEKCTHPLIVECRVDVAVVTLHDFEQLLHLCLVLQL